MTTKQIIISSSGLKNIVLNKYQEDEDFIFAFGEQKFQMKSFFAEFISPAVSRLHKTDPTINEINFRELNTNKDHEFTEFFQSVLTPEIISLFVQISSGFSIEINEEEAIKLRFLSNFLGNEELHNKLNELFPPKYNEENINSYVKSIESYYHFSRLNPDFDFGDLLSFVSSHFYQLNKDDFLRLPRYLQHEIISHPNLQIESEDSLFDIIIEIIEKKKESEENNEIVDDALFLEQIEFSQLSEERLRIFVDVFDVNEMNVSIWNKLVECLFNHSVKESKRIASKFRSSIIVAGYDKYNLLGESPNNQSIKGNPIISPSLKSSIDPSSLLSYSIYDEHSVLVTCDGSLLGIGDNRDGRISNSLPKTLINQFTEFSINDENGHHLTPISAVCSGCGTLYMLSKSGDEKRLVYCDRELYDRNQVFLNIGDNIPVSLFGGYYHVAVINDKGEIILINRDEIKNDTKSQIMAVSLPDGEKASNVVCMEHNIYVLSSKFHVFSSDVKSGNFTLSFSRVKELVGEEIVCLSGTHSHCLAVNKEGHVFSWGSNEEGQLGLGEETESVSVFTEISSLQKYKIKEAYTGPYHSLFVTEEGKILACGYNNCNELLLRSGPTSNIVYFPIETTITKDATFCITGNSLTAVFIGSFPPPNTPNIRIK